MSRLSQARQATREQLKARVALDGPSGAGKTWTALEWATVLAGDGKPLHIDTEHGSASLYADRFDFETLRWDPPYDIDELADTIKDAGAAYPVIVVDSWSHFWEGEGGTLDTADAAGQRSGGGNSFAGWKVATPKLRHLVDVILASPAHVIVTMRTKTEWVVEPDPRTGKMVPRRVGTAPVMRQGIEYEFTLVGDLDIEHRLVITKSRCAPLADVVVQPGRAADAAETFSAWLDSGEAMPAPADVQALKDNLNAMSGAARKAFKARWAHPDRVTSAQLPDVLAWVAEQQDDDPGPDGPGEGSPLPMGGGDAEQEAPDLGASGEASPSGGSELSPDNLAPDAGEDAAAPADSPADGDRLDAATRGRMFALVGELCPDAANLSRAANEEVRKRWLLELASAVDGCEYSSRTQIGEGAAAKVIAAMEHVVDGQASYADFVEGRWQVTRRANGGITVAKRRGRAA